MNNPKNDTMKYDVRLYEHKIRTGEITEEEWKKYIESLPDSSENAVELNLEHAAYPDDNLH